MEIRRSYYPIISTVGFPILLRHLYIEPESRLFNIANEILWDVAGLRVLIITLLYSHIKLLCFAHIIQGFYHYTDVIMSAMASSITGVLIVYSAVFSGSDQRKYQGSVSLSFERGIHRWPLNSPHGPVTRTIFPFDDVNMYCQIVPTKGSVWGYKAYKS